MKAKTALEKGLPPWPSDGNPLTAVDESLIMEFIKTGNKAQSYRKFYPYDDRVMSPVNYFRLPLVIQFLKDYAADLPINDAVVDEKLLDIINNSKDQRSVIAAVKEYNRLRTRIIDTIAVAKYDFDTSKLSDGDLDTIVAAMIKKSEEKDGTS